MSSYKQLLAIAENQDQLGKLMDWFHRNVRAYEAAENFPDEKFRIEIVEGVKAQLKLKLAHKLVEESAKYSLFTEELGSFGKFTRVTYRMLTVKE